MALPLDDEEQLVSYWPNPPPFYKHFTTKNIDALARLKEEDSITDDVSAPFTAAQILSLPAELRYLVPPEPPSADASYHVFGKQTKVNEVDDYPEVVKYIRSKLWDENENVGILDWTYEQLYPSADPNWSSQDRQAYLFRFIRSIIMSYIELLGIVAQDPMSPAREEKLKHIMTLVLNMHALINEYRPHQARETLLRVLEEQVDRKRAEVEGVRKMGARVKEVLEGFERGVEEAKEREEEPPSEHGEEERRKERQREMWGVMDELLGH